MHAIKNLRGAILKGCILTVHVGCPIYMSYDKCQLRSHLCGCMCASSCLTSGGSACCSTDTGMVWSRCGSSGASTEWKRA